MRSVSAELRGSSRPLARRRSAAPGLLLTDSRGGYLGAAGGLPGGKCGPGKTTILIQVLQKKGCGALWQSQRQVAKTGLI